LMKATSKEPSKPATPKAKSTSNPDKVFPDEALPLDALKAVEADLRFKAGQILLPKLTVAKLNTAVRLKAGRLTLNPLSAIIGGGKLDSSLSVSPMGKAAAIMAKLKIDKLGIGTLTKEAGLPEGIEGVLDADLDIKGTGASVAKLMAGLDGHLSLIVDDGRIHNKYIDLLNSDLITGLIGFLNPARSKKDYTAVKCLVTRFDVKKGLATPTALLFDSDLMRIVGDGKIDLRSEVLDLKLTPQPKKSLGTEKGILGQSLSELAQPFLVGGTLAKPAITVDKTDAAVALSKTLGGLLGQNTSSPAQTTSDDKDPCIAAVTAAKTGVPVKKEVAKKPAEPEKKSIIPSVPVKDLPDVGKTLKGLFGK